MSDASWESIVAETIAENRERHIATAKFLRAYPKRCPTCAVPVRHEDGVIRPMHPCDCGNLQRPHFFSDVGCEYHEHHCERCHEWRICTLSECRAELDRDWIANPPMGAAEWVQYSDYKSWIATKEEPGHNEVDLVDPMFDPSIGGICGEQTYEGICQKPNGHQRQEWNLGPSGERQRIIRWLREVAGKHSYFGSNPPLGSVEVWDSQATARKLADRLEANEDLDLDE